MKRFVVIGLGTFGSAAAEALTEQGHEVVAIDTDEAKVEHVARTVARAVVGDGRSVEVLKRTGAEGADVGIVGTGSDMAASILAVLALRDVGVPHIYAKVLSQDHARVMNGVGVTETVFPERESAINLAVRLARGTALRNYIRLGHGFSLQEMPVPKAWQGRSLRDLALTQHYRISVVSIYDPENDALMAVPDPDEPLRASALLVVTGTAPNLERVCGIE